ncbi:hypothetical protein MRX96_035774 [Rhipicephalus microplus]
MATLGCFRLSGSFWLIVRLLSPSDAIGRMINSKLLMVPAKAFGGFSTTSVSIPYVEVKEHNLFSCCLIVQGTWLIQIAFLLFDPREGKRWDPRSDRDAMLAAAIFPVHVVAALVYVCLLGTVFSRRAEVAYSRLAQEADKEKEHCLSAASVRPGILAALIP